MCVRDNQPFSYGKLYHCYWGLKYEWLFEDLTISNFQLQNAGLGFEPRFPPKYLQQRKDQRAM